MQSMVAAALSAVLARHVVQSQSLEAADAPTEKDLQRFGSTTMEQNLRE